MGENQIIPEIRDNYKKYLILLKKQKTLFVSPIVLDSKTNNANFNTKEVQVKHSELLEEHKLVVESKERDDKSFKFKLHTSEYRSPFFRYDSDGLAHRNNLDSIPLAEQQITTPHFHKFIEGGIGIAYKTNELKINTINYENINNAIMHFCDESNTRYNNNKYPKVEQHPGKLPFPVEKYDPLSDINF